MTRPRVIQFGSWYYLSFCDPARPKGTQFLGACIVGPVPDMVAACNLAWARGCNPGGEVQGLAIEDDKERKVPESFRNRLLTKDEVLVELEAHMSEPEVTS